MECFFALMCVCVFVSGIFLDLCCFLFCIVLVQMVRKSLEKVH